MTNNDESVTDESIESTETEAVETEQVEASEDEAKPDPNEGARKALSAERTARKAADKRVKELEAEAANRDKPVEEQALEAARSEARAEATTKANERLLRSELKAAATGKMADPTDAALYLDLTSFDVNDDGDVDSDALADAIAELLTRKPHLGMPDARKFGGSADQGAKKSESGPSQWTEADLQKADREGRSDDIAKAKAGGNLNTILGIK
jgi:hypothetical protein